MLARSRNLGLTSRSLPGPLLVPSVSSKGFPLVNGVSEAGLSVVNVAQDLTETVLLSAYDLAHGLLSQSDELLGPGHRHTPYGTPELLVVDSGGYELNRTDFEAGEMRRDEHNPQPFNREDFERLADRLPADRDMLVVSYDEPVCLRDPCSARGTYAEQRQQAQKSFQARRHFKSDFLLKPEGRTPYLHVRALTIEAPNFVVSTSSASPRRSSAGPSSTAWSPWPNSGRSWTAAAAATSRCTCSAVWTRCTRRCTSWPAARSSMA